MSALPRIGALCALAASLALLGGCVVKTAGSIAATGVKTGARVGAGAVKTTAKGVGAVAGAATADGDQDAIHKERDEPRPFDRTRDAQADVDRALAAAQANGTRALIVLGGNWCHDSRGLAAKFERPELRALIEREYELVFVDVGYRDRNLDVPARFGVFEVRGTPTVLIVDGKGLLLNRETVHDWSTAHSIPYDRTLSYFRAFAASSVDAP